jgi:hypothetical protein
MVEEEGGRGVSTALIVAGGIGCLVIGVLLFAGFFFVRGSSVSSPPPSGPALVAPPGWQEVERTGAPGQVGRTILRGPTDGSGRELRAYWLVNGALDEEHSGAYSGETRERALTEEERAMLQGLDR